MLNIIKKMLFKIKLFFMKDVEAQHNFIYEQEENKDDK